MVYAIMVCPGDVDTFFDGERCWDEAAVHGADGDGDLILVESFVVEDSWRERHDVIWIVVAVCLDGCANAVVGEEGVRYVFDALAPVEVV